MRPLLKGLLEAEPWSLRGVLFRVAFAILAVTIGYLAIGAGSRNGIAGGLTGSVVLLILAIAAQRLAERRGIPERERGGARSGRTSCSAGRGGSRSGS